LSKGYENGQEQATHESGGGVPVIGNLKTSHWGYQTRPVRPIHHTSQTGMVTPTGLRALLEGNSQNWQIWVRTRTCPVMAEFIRWSSNSNSHIVYRTSLVQYRTSPINDSRSQ
jgi:hypothetical protein